MTHAVNGKRQQQLRQCHRSTAIPLVAAVAVFLLLTLWLLHIPDSSHGLQRFIKRLSYVERQARVAIGRVAVSDDDHPFRIYPVTETGTNSCSPRLAALTYVQRLQAANLLFPYLYRANVPASVFSQLQVVAGINFQQRHHQMVYSKDMYELIRYRYCTRNELNRIMSIAELQSIAVEEASGKGVYRPYQHVFTIHNHPTSKDHVDGVELSAGEVYLYDHSSVDACVLRNISLKYQPQCKEDSWLEEMDVKQLLIVAAQRSGKQTSLSLILYVGGRLEWLQTTAGRSLRSERPSPVESV
jgi:hypothetical protein